MIVHLDSESLPPGRLRRTLEELAEAPLDYADLRELIRLDELIADAGGRTPARVLADQPVHVGNTTLYMPGLGAMAYLYEHLDEWFADDPVLADPFVAWVCHLGRQPERLRAVTDVAAARAAVLEWLAGLSCTAAELEHAAAAGLDGFPVVAAGGGEAGSANILALAEDLLARYGGSLHAWLWDEPLQRVLWLDRERANAAAPRRTEQPGFLHAATAFRQWRQHLRRRHRDPDTDSEEEGTTR